MTEKPLHCLMNKAVVFPVSKTQRQGSAHTRLSFMCLRILRTNVHFVHINFNWTEDQLST